MICPPFPFTTESREMAFADIFAAAVENMVQLHEKEVQGSIPPNKDMSDCTKWLLFEFDTGGGISQASHFVDEFIVVYKEMFTIGTVCAWLWNTPSHEYHY